MKILMVNTFHYPRGGDANYSRGLSRLLTSAGHEVIPLAMRHPDNEPSEWEGRFVSWIDIREAPFPAQRLALLGRMFWSREAARAARDLIAELQPDVAHLQHIHRHITPSVLDPLNSAGIPVVWTVHDYELICPQGHLFTAGAPCERCKGHNYLEAIRHRCKWGELGASVAAAFEKELHQRRGVWERVDRFLCPSAFLANRLVDFGVPAERVVHQPNFLDPADHPRSTGVGEGWLYAGRLAPEKGVDLLLEVARRLPARHRLWICGTGPLEATLKARAADLPQIRFLGHLPPNALAELIRRVRVVAVPSIWYENFPYAVLEAQSAARAVIASDIGGIPEQIDSGVDGLLAPPGQAGAWAEAVGRLLDDPNLAASMGERGAERVRARLAPADHLRAIESIYVDLCGVRPGRASG